MHCVFGLLSGAGGLCFRQVTLEVYEQLIEEALEYNDGGVGTSPGRYTHVSRRQLKMPSTSMIGLTRHQRNLKNSTSWFPGWRNWGEKLEERFGS